MNVLKKNEKNVFRRILWGGVFLIGLGVILLADLPWSSILILTGLIVIAEGVIRLIRESEGEEK